MRKLVALLSISGLIISFSCSKEDFSDEPLLPYKLVGYPKESGVDIRFTRPGHGLLPGALSQLPQKVNRPESYDIFISKEPGIDFRRTATQFTNENRISLNDLENGIPYYITVRANKRGFSLVQYDTIMVVASKLKQTRSISWRYDQAQKITFSPTTDSAAFIAQITYSGWSETPDLYIYPYYNESVQVGKNIAECEWSPSGELIAVLKKMDDSNSIDKSLKLSVYTIKANSFNDLSVQSESLASIEFSADSKWIYYVDDSENNLIWRIKTDGQQKEMVVGRQTAGLEKTTGFEIDRISIHSNGEDIYFSGSQNEVSKIYRYNQKSGTAEVVLNDQWSSFSPSLSPDGQKLAFYSTRSGQRALWVYEFSNTSYRQLTGFERGGWFDQKIDWLSNTELSIGNTLIQL
ncbi:MAG: hypothetical protein RIF36_22995 [Imperialibacter sp.]|uniref:hypothetical protein n=1 Tax=Imperialibacter sp. TaxID=2038411 RepID=UPI0032EB8A71